MPAGIMVCGGLSSNTILEFKCVSEWGRDFLLVLFAVTLAYVGGGILFAQRQPTADFEIRTALSRHPHFAQWIQLPGMCVDGLGLTKVTLLRLKSLHIDKDGAYEVVAAEAAKGEAPEKEKADAEHPAARARESASGSESGTGSESE